LPSAIRAGYVMDGETQTFPPDHFRERRYAQNSASCWVTSVTFTFSNTVDTKTSYASESGCLVDSDMDNVPWLDSHS